MSESAWENIQLSYQSTIISLNIFDMFSLFTTNLMPQKNPQ